jgi:hypothetical protein
MSPDNPKPEKLMCRIYPNSNNIDGLNCGHRISPITVPNTNCPGCWLTFFTANPDSTKQNLLVLQTDGGEILLRQKTGVKYAKHLKHLREFLIEQKETLADVTDADAIISEESAA